MPGNLSSYAPNRPRSTNPAYLCRIINATSGVDVIADLPEHISISTSSSFESLSLSLLDIGRATSVIAKGVGGNVASKAATKQIWRDSGPIEFTLSLIFDANTNSRNDVHLQLIQLQQLSLPLGNGGESYTARLYPPNPWRGLNGISGQENRTIVILGNMFKFEPCLVVSANLNEDIRMAADGFPIAGQIDITFRTDYTFDRTDYLKAAGGSPEQIQAAQRNVLENNVLGGVFPLPPARGNF